MYFNNKAEIHWKMCVQSSNMHSSNLSSIIPITINSTKSFLLQVTLEIMSPSIFQSVIHRP